MALEQAVRLALASNLQVELVHVLSDTSRGRIPQQEQTMRLE